MGFRFFTLTIVGTTAGRSLHQLRPAIARHAFSLNQGVTTPTHAAAYKSPYKCYWSSFLPSYRRCSSWLAAQKEVLGLGVSLEPEPGKVLENDVVVLVGVGRGSVTEMHRVITLERNVSREYFRFAYSPLVQCAPYIFTGQKEWLDQIMFYKMS